MKTLLKIALIIDAVIVILMTILVGLVLYWSLISMNEKPDPNWIEEPSNELMDYK